MATKTRKRNKPASTDGMHRGIWKAPTKLLADWQVKASVGVDKIFATPSIMLQAAEEYFTWCDNNPMNKAEAKVVDKCVEIIEIPLKRPYSWVGFCLFCNVNTRYFDTFKRQQRENAEEFNAVIASIENYIYRQKMDGAHLGHFNANLVSRELGLADHIKNDNTNVNVNVQPTAEESKAILDAINKNI